MKKITQSRRRKGRALFLTAIMVLSLAAMSASFAGAAAAQEPTVSERTISPTEAANGTTVQVTIDVEFDSDTEFSIKENFNSDLENLTLVQNDSAFTANPKPEEGSIQWNFIGSTATDSATVVYEADIPSEAQPGTTYSFDGNVTSDQAYSVAGDDTLTVAEETPASGTVSFEDQATFSTSYTTDGLSDPAVAVSAESDTDSAIVVTHGDNLTIAAVGAYDASELDGSSTKVLEIPNESVAPNASAGLGGEHTAHLIPQEDLSSDYAPGDEVSDDTAQNIVNQSSATVYMGLVDFRDQTFNGETTELTVDSTLSNEATNALYTVDVHQKTDDGSFGSYVGSTDVLSAGSNDGETVFLEDSDGNDVTLSPGTDEEYIAMIHLVNNDSVSEGDSATPGQFPPLPNTDTSGVIPSGVTDDANITVQEEAAEFTVSDLDATTLGDGEFVPSDTVLNDGSSAVATLDTIQVTANISNPGDVSDEQTVEFQFNGDQQATETVDLEGGESMMVTFNVTAPDVDPGSYTHGVATEADSQTADIYILPYVEAGEVPARDTTGEFNGADNPVPTLDDVNGNGELDILDVTAVFDLYQEGASEDVGPYFDFNSNGELDILDVTELFDLYQAQN